MKSEKVLLIIDMQKGLFTAKTPRFDTEGVVARINKLAKLFREMNYQVIFIRHDGSGTGEFEKNTEEWELLDELQTNPADILIDKYANDAFYKSELQSVLNELQTSELYVTGCATDFCVESTIQSALTKDYHVVVVGDGHTTGERPHLNAEKIVEHYNWVWQNMIPTKSNVSVKSFSDLKLVMEAEGHHIRGK